MVTTPPDEEIVRCRAWLETVIDVDCRSGLYDEEAILDAIREMIDGELGGPVPALYEECAAWTRAGLAARASDELGWTGRTSNDRLESAFADLSARGLVTGQAVGYTLQEGAALIDAIVAENGGARGSVFYHRQDLESAIAGHGLALAFTAYDPEVGEPSRAIGREIVAVLEHHGLAVQWNGTRETRILVTPFVWQRRRTTKAPPGPSPAPPSPTAPGARPAAAHPCSICGGRGWVHRDPSSFPEACACKRGG